MFITCGCQCLAVKCAWLLAMSGSCIMNPTPATFLLPAVNYCTGVSALRTTQKETQGPFLSFMSFNVWCCTGERGVDSSIWTGR